MLYNHIRDVGVGSRGLTNDAPRVERRSALQHFNENRTHAHGL